MHLLMKGRMMKTRNIVLFAILIIIIAIIGSIILYSNTNKENTIIASTPINAIENEEDILEEQVIVVLLSDKNEEELVTEENVIQAPEINQNEQIYASEELKDKEFYIKVNNLANVVTIYIKDGENLVPYKAMICSTGTDTPEDGIYTIKSRWNWLALFGNVYGKYATQIVGNILFHSVPYLEKSSDTLEYWEYDKLGTSASMGCIRLTVEDAKWIYDNIPRGTEVEFYSSEEPGPLGKPEAQKISDNEECRNWDPTDENPDNPWNN